MPNNSEPQDLPPVPPRLLRLLPYVAAGSSNREIALQLCLAPHTVKNYIGELILHFHCVNRLKLVIATQEYMALQANKERTP